MPDSSYIEFAGIRKAFGDKVVYDDLSLSIRRGETLTIVGSSGSGKSVLLRMLIGLMAPDAGVIRFDGREVSGMDEEQLFTVRRRISMMFQGGALFDSLTVGENVAYPLRQQLSLSEHEIAARVSDKLTLVDLAGSETQMPSALSGGMRKRVALARAIVADPAVILLDEPTAGLDPITTRRVDELISAIRRKLQMTAIFVTHDLPSAYRVSDRIAMLSDHRILAVLSAVEFHHSRIPAIHEFVSAMDDGPDHQPQERGCP